MTEPGTRKAVGLNRFGSASGDNSTGSVAAIGNPAGWRYDGTSSFFLAALVWVMVLYMAVPGWIFLPPEQRVLSMSANPASRAVKLGLLTVSVFVILWRSRLAFALLRSINPFFVFFLVLAPLSAIWSIDSGATIARFISILSLISVYIAFTLAGWHRQRFQDVIRPIITALLIGSIVLGVISPRLVETHDPGSPTLEGAWTGLLGQKNPFGQLCSFGIIFSAHSWLSGERRWWNAMIGGAIAALCIVLSRSATSLLATFFSIVFMLLLLRAPDNLRRYVPYIVVMFAGTVLTYALAVLKLVPGLDVILLPIMAITGKDMTFSNRSVIWEIIKDHFQYTPIFGSGYGAYWVGPEPTSPSFVFLAKMYFYPTESHNGYLEVANDLGFVGMFCLFGYLIFHVRQSLRLMKADRAQGALFLCLFFQQTIINLSESCWLQINSFSFVIMSIATIALGRSLLDEDLKASFGSPNDLRPGALSRRR